MDNDHFIFIIWFALLMIFFVVLELKFNLFCFDKIIIRMANIGLCKQNYERIKSNSIKNCVLQTYLFASKNLCSSRAHCICAGDHKLMIFAQKLRFHS